MSEFSPSPFDLFRNFYLCAREFAFRTFCVRERTNWFQIIKETGFLDGLFSEEELNSDNIKDKDAKLAFLTKLIDVVSQYLILLGHHVFTAKYVRCRNISCEYCVF